jgi:putative membrane protein
MNRGHEMSNLALPQTTVRGPDGRTDRIPLLHVAVWLLFAAFVLRFAALWANGLMGTSLPVLGRIGFTLLFAAFSVAHATSRLGWQRALLFLLACATVSWSFEEVGVTTGLVYGAYHYGTALGPKLAAVPAIIPLAWFMMTYASWVVANLFLEGASDLDSARLTTARIVVAAMVMTAWDTVMDPGMARSGVWTWDQGGAYFGVPTHNFAGWLGTMLTIYLIAEIGFRRLGARPSDTAPRLYAGLPVLAYAILALDRVLLPDMPELRINAAFGMGLVALIAVLRLTLVGRVPS